MDTSVSLLRYSTQPSKMPTTLRPSRPVVSKRSSSIAILKRQSLVKLQHKTGEKAANHDAMMRRFNLRKMSSNLPIHSKFSRASEVIIDKALEAPRPCSHRFSLTRSLRKMTSVKTRKSACQRLTSPIMPTSWASTCHAFIMLVVYHFQLLYLPFCTSYLPRGSFGTAIIEMLLETIFLLDMLVNFNTAYVDHGVLVTSRSKIAQRYIRSWFAFDLLSAVPIQFLCYFLTENYTTDTLRGIQTTLMVLRLLRVSFFERSVLVGRIMRVANHFVEWARHSRYSHLLRIAQLMWLVLLFAHYMACMWHVVSCKDEPRVGSVGEWYAADYFHAVSLIQGEGMDNATWVEYVYSSVVIIVGSGILAIVFGNVAMLVSNFNASINNYYRKMEAVYETMEKMDLPLRLRDRVKEYYKHVWVEYESLDGNINQFQKELTHTLGTEIRLYKHMNLVLQVPFWKDCTPDFLTQIVQNLDVRVYMPDDYVLRRRETGSEMLMLNRGYCKQSKPAKVDTRLSILTTDMDQTVRMDTYQSSDSESEGSDDWSSDDEEFENFGDGLFGSPINYRADLSDDHKDDFTSVRRFQSGRSRRPSYPGGTESKKSKKFREYLHPGQAFGEMSLLMNYKRTANIRAITFVEMCVLSRKNFQQIISRYPEDRRRVLTSMLESCIEQKVIPFPWENIVQAVMAKRRNEDKKGLLRADDIATMTAKEAARILVEAIDINAPDESIKYGFQNFDQEFIDDSSLRHANSANPNTFQRRGGNSVDNLKTNGSECSTITSDSTDVEEFEPSSTSDGQSTKTLQSLLLLVQNMAGNIESMAGSIERLEKDVSDLTKEHRGLRHCCSCGSGLDQQLPGGSETFLWHVMNEYQQAQAPRTSSIGVLPTSPASDNSPTNCRTGSRSKTFPSLRKVRTGSCMQDLRAVPDRYIIESAWSEVVGVCDTHGHHSNFSSRSGASRTQTLTDMLWNRSNTNGDMLKHSEAERKAALLKRQLRTRPSLLSEMGKTTQSELPTKPSPKPKQYVAKLSAACLRQQLVASFP